MNISPRRSTTSSGTAAAALGPVHDVADRVGAGGVEPLELDPVQADGDQLKVPSAWDSTSVIFTRQPTRNSDWAPCSPTS